MIQFSTEAVNKRSISGGIFQGACEFCGKDIKTFPSVNEQKSVPPAELYCCDDYRNFVDYVVKTPLLEEKDKKMIDIKPHAPFGSKQARRAAKERAAQRYTMWLWYSILINIHVYQNFKLLVELLYNL